MRLIDADKLTKDRVENDPVRIAAGCAPTAFDKEKVIEELIKYREYYDINEEPKSRIGSKEYFPECADIRERKGKWIAYDHAIEIVEKGGIE